MTLDYDGSVLSTGRHAEGTAVGFNKKKKGARSYYPLFCTVAQTDQVLDVHHRPGNVHDSNEEVIVLRKAKRLSANVRQHFSIASGRAKNRDAFERHLADHPLSPKAFQRFLDHVERLLDDGSENERDVLDRGWF